MVKRVAFLLIFVAFVHAQNSNAQSQVQQADSYSYGQNPGSGYGQNPGIAAAGVGFPNPQVPSPVGLGAVGMGAVGMGAQNMGGLAQGPGFGQFQNPYMGNPMFQGPGMDHRRFIGGYGMRKLNFNAHLKFLSIFN
jgi:hypothetical protein